MLTFSQSVVNTFDRAVIVDGLTIADATRRALSEHNLSETVQNASGVLYFASVLSSEIFDDELTSRQTDIMARGVVSN